MLLSAASRYVKLVIIVSPLRLLVSDYRITTRLQQRKKVEREGVGVMVNLNVWSSAARGETHFTNPHQKSPPSIQPSNTYPLIAYHFTPTLCQKSAIFFLTTSINNYFNSPS